MEHYEYTFEDLMRGLEDTSINRKSGAIEAAKKLYFKLLHDLEALMEDEACDPLDMRDVIWRWFRQHKEEIELCQILIPGLMTDIMTIKDRHTLHYGSNWIPAINKYSRKNRDNN